MMSTKAVSTTLSRRTWALRWAPSRNKLAMTSLTMSFAAAGTLAASSSIFHPQRAGLYSRNEGHAINQDNDRRERVLFYPGRMVHLLGRWPLGVGRREPSAGSLPPAPPRRPRPAQGVDGALHQLQGGGFRSGGLPEEDHRVLGLVLHTQVVEDRRGFRRQLAGLGGPALAQVEPRQLQGDQGRVGGKGV